VDGRGDPLSLVVTVANRHNVNQVESVLSALAMIGRTPKIKSHGDEANELRVRCWVVEATHGWFSRFRKILVRYKRLGAPS
jgi:transposase